MDSVGIPSLPSMPFVHPDIHCELERLPLLPEGEVFESTDSHDVTGFNDDGFSSRYSYLYKTDEGLVLYDRKGPGSIRLIRTIGFTGVLNIYLDEETEPSVCVPFDRLYSGLHPGFPAHLVGHEDDSHGSSWCFVPIPFRTRCRVLATDKVESHHFYNILAYAGPGDGRIETASSAQSPHRMVSHWTAPNAFVEKASGMDVSGMVVDVPRGGQAELLSTDSAGTICWLRMLLPDADRSFMLRHLHLRVWWDDDVSPSVDAPLGLFFATGYGDCEPARENGHYTVTQGEEGTVRFDIPLGRVAPRSVAIGELDSGLLYCHFPMPFWKRARFALVNLGDSDCHDVTFQVGVSRTVYPEGSGYFHAFHRAETGTLPNRDFSVAAVRGSGRYVGAVLRMSSRGLDARCMKVQRLYLEGDARFYIDDSLAFVGASTGTEEYFNWGWYDMAPKDQVFTFPTHGYVEHIRDAEDHSTMYRLHVTDSVPYYRSFRFDLEHGPEGSTSSDYDGVAFFYHRDALSLILTDCIDFQTEEMENLHSCFIEEPVWKGRLQSVYEGNDQVVAKHWKDSYGEDYLRIGGVASSGRSFLGCSGFQAAIREDNRGVRLRRRFDGRWPFGIAGDPHGKSRIAGVQEVGVSIDGVHVGNWLCPAHHARDAFMEDGFEIPSTFTEGKSHIFIELSNVAEDGWNEFTYWVFTYIGIGATP
jgi:hypothetical protein